MKLSELPNLNRALDLMGLDIGGNPVSTAVIPSAWLLRCQIADTELATLTPDELSTLASGEESDVEQVAKKAPVAHEIMNASFDDGELADVFFEHWQNIFDARNAEHRVAKSFEKFVRKNES